MVDRSDAAVRAIGATIDALAVTFQDDARKLAALSLTAVECGRTDVGYTLARQARARGPRDPEVLAMTQPALSAGVAGWHGPMLTDDRRSTQYRAAIERTVRRGDRVLDIGSGTGLLAMIAARAGAAHVYSCEMVPAVADVAKDVVALNGFADRITIIPRKSMQIDAEADLGGRVDMLISEIIASDLIGEGMLPAIEDAAGRLLAPGGRMLPIAGDIIVALAEIPSQDPRLIGDVCGFDLSAINRLERRPLLIETDSDDMTLRSAPQVLYGFDFTRGRDWGQARTSVDLVANGGRVNGVLLWMRLRIDAIEVYESAPSPGRRSSWVTKFFRIDPARDIPAGDVVRAEALRHATTLRLWVP